MNTDSPNETFRMHSILKRLPKGLRGHIVAMLGEFIGTLSFIFFAFAGTQTANIASNTNTGTTIITTVAQKNPAQLLYISLSFGFSLAVNAWVFFRISGGLFNPAVTIGMVLIGAITIFRGVLLFIVQLAGAIAGAYIVDALFTGGLNVSTTLSATTTIAQGVIIEMILTAMLCFTIFMLAAEKHTGNFIAPVGIGLALFISELVGVFWTGGSLNPARSLAPAVVVQEFHSEHWVYWVGPIAGSILAVIIFKMIKALEYETANPDPESAAPTGPVPDDFERSESRRTGEQDLERAYSGASKEVAVPQRMDPVLNNISVQNSTVKPVYPTNGMVQNNVVPQTNGVPHNTYRVTDAQTYISQAPEPTLQNSQLQYSNQPVASVGDESRWNAVHTANARQNTVMETRI